MSKSSKTRSRQLSRAQLKAYEARRAEEINEASVEAQAVRAEVSHTIVPRRSVMMSRSEEMAIIRADLRRLITILAVISIFLVILPFFLR